MNDAAPPPSKLGKYEIQREIGRGSMGVVYSAFDPYVGRPVAVKVAMADALKERGHVIVTGTGVFGGYQAILRDPETGVYHGASESRKDGHAAGW